MRVFIILLFIANLCFAQELKTITPDSFYKQNPSYERKEIISFIVGQFDKKREFGITQSQLDNIWNNLDARKAFSISRFQIVKQKLYADSLDPTHPYFLSLLSYLKKFVNSHKINDIDFIVCTRDEINRVNGLEKLIMEAPVFMGSKNINSAEEKDVLLFPDPFIIHESWKELLSRINLANYKYNWEDKQSKIFWRGGTTGGSEGAYQLSNFDKLPRIALIILSKLYPDLIDAKFTYYMESAFNKNGKDLRKILDLLFGKDLYKVKEEDHLKYKYLIAIDGNTSPWVRVPWIMYSNSVLVKQESNNIQWFYTALKPYIHYIPVKENLSDIFAKINWMKFHDEELKQISKNSQTFIKNNLMPEHIDSYMAIILNEYSKIQKDDVIIASLTEAEDVLSMQVLIKSLLNQLHKKITFWFQ